MHSPSVQRGTDSVAIAEWNINQPYSTVVRGIYESGADMVLFSTYIWNRDFVFRVAAETRQVCPNILIGMGGPEVSWSSRQTFGECASVDFLVCGEGEESFCDLIDRVNHGENIEGTPGIRTRKTDTFIPRKMIQDLDDIPFPYTSAVMDFDAENRIVYYESSRGCPFSCAYCLSSIDKSIRYYSLERVLSDIDFFIDNGIPLVKFVDRTFNLDPTRYMAIWEHIRERHNGKTLFHFEIAAEFLSEEALTFLQTMPEGSIQFEIGIQSINAKTLETVGRPAHPDALAKKIRAIPEHIHVHVDLIAGLPHEDIESFSRSFNYAFDLHPGMLQLGFLKILSGTEMEKLAKAMPEYIYSPTPPYEVLSSPSVSYEDMLMLKDIEHIVDSWYNSGLMKKTLEEIVSGNGNDAFSVFGLLVNHIRTHYPDGDVYMPRRPQDSFACMAAFIGKQESQCARAMEYLRYDYLLQGKPGVFPEWFERRYSKARHDESLEKYGYIGQGGESRRNAYARSEYDTFFFGEKDRLVELLFVYGEKKNSRRPTVIIIL
jgi:radical SAM superfamily enzyme YgiQ (UPF0313 family)